MTLAAKAELKAGQHKIVKIEAFDSSYLHGKNFFGNDGFQNMFVYQLTFINTLNLRKGKGTDNVVGWKSKDLFEVKLLSLHGAFLCKTKYFAYQIRIQFNNTPLVVEQNNYTTKAVSAYTVYDLDNWPENPLRNFILINCLFGATNLVKKGDKEKYVYSSYEITFDGKDE